MCGIFSDITLNSVPTGDIDTVMEYDPTDLELQGMCTAKGVLISDGTLPFCVIDHESVVLPCPDCDSISNDATSERCRDCGEPLQSTEPDQRSSID